MTRPYPRDLMRADRDGVDPAKVQRFQHNIGAFQRMFSEPIRPAVNQPEPIGRDHDCQIHPDPVPADPERTVEDRLAVLERDIAWLRRAVQDLGTLNR